MQNYKPTQFNFDLNELEKSVMFNKNTERPYSGAYDNFYKQGQYLCNNCKNPLYSSKAKFDAGCGWPAFDNCYNNAIKYQIDDDGNRTEILCAACSTHLGHIFEGEHLTATNTRHCVNSASIKFEPTSSIPTSAVAVVGCGCFWGVQFYFDKLKGVISTEVGYAGGSIIRPTYEEVCSGKSGHYEVLKIEYNPQIINYKELIKYFFEIHDFEQANGQGNDIGEQYKSIIFYQNQPEFMTIKNLIGQLVDLSFDVKTIIKILDYKNSYWPAEEYHQKYYNKNGQSPYCHFWNKINWQDL
jgi:peptide methionine sulfoxide reductase msrA/msrB